MVTQNQDTSVSGYPGYTGLSRYQAAMLLRIFEKFPDSVFPLKIASNVHAVAKKGLLAGLRGQIMQPISFETALIKNVNLWMLDNAHRFHEFLIDPEQQRLLDEIEHRADVDWMLVELYEWHPRACAAVMLRYGFYGDVYKLREIGEELGVTRERARQLIEIGLDLLRMIALKRALIQHITKQGGSGYVPRKVHPSKRRRGVGQHSAWSYCNRPTKADRRTWATAPVVADILGIQPRVLYRWVNHGSFPKPRRREDGSDYYLVGDVERWAFDHDQIRYRIGES